MINWEYMLAVVCVPLDGCIVQKMKTEKKIHTYSRRVDENYTSSEKGFFIGCLRYLCDVQ